MEIRKLKTGESFVFAKVRKSATKVIGHTKSGKPVYEIGFHHPSVKSFSKQDHLDAAHLHDQYGAGLFEENSNEHELANGEERDVHPDTPTQEEAYYHRDQEDLHKKAAKEMK